MQRMISKLGGIPQGNSQIRKVLCMPAFNLVRFQQNLLQPYMKDRI